MINNNSPEIFAFRYVPGMTDTDYKRYPDKTFQLEWIRIYLENYHKSDDRIIDDKYINEVYIDVNKFALVAWYIWTLWGLIQAEHSLIDYDFIE